MTVEIRIVGETASEALAEVLTLASGISPRYTPPPRPAAEERVVPDVETPDEQPEVAGEPTARAYGLSEDGKARRTKAQIAQDTEIEELAKKLGIAKIPTDVSADSLMDELRQSAAAEPSPEGVEEAEEVEKPAATRDDVRGALAAYADKFGMPAAQKNGPALLGASKISDIADDPAAYQAAIDRIHAAIAEG